MPEPVLAWHFTKDRLCDGRPIPPIGKTLRYDGDEPLALYHRGLHASVRALDALWARGPAVGSIMHRVLCGGQIEQGDEQLVCSERTILWSADISETAYSFARWCALQVIDLCDAPKIVKEYLSSDDETLRSAVFQAVARETSRSARATTYPVPEIASWAKVMAPVIASRTTAAFAARAATAAAQEAAANGYAITEANFSAEFEKRPKRVGSRQPRLLKGTG